MPSDYFKGPTHIANLTKYKEKATKEWGKVEEEVISGMKKGTMRLKPEDAEKAMQKLKIKPQIINHIMTKKNPEILAKNLQDWLTGKKPK